ncbi:MAG: 50S ribosomal protein L25 [Verrucomicrobia bacterium]|nr:MAG: 50S ribosomal protein L25 [Verrucomicrobiota bacterium]
MKSVPLNAFARTQGRRAGSKKLRESGRVPAVIYGGQVKPVSLELDARVMNDLIHHSVSENILVDLSVDSQKRLALVQEVQHHPLTQKVVHVDFHEVSPTEKVTVMVPVETTGEAAGVKTGGGVLQHIVFKLKVRALPKDLPEQIVVDVSHLEVGKSVHLGDIKAPEGVEILGDKKVSIISVALPKTEVEETAVAAEGAAPAAGDVEMLKEKKEDGTEGAAPAKPGDKAAPAKGDAKAAAAPAKDAKAAPAAEKKK